MSFLTMQPTLEHQKEFRVFLNALVRDNRSGDNRLAFSALAGTKLPKSLCFFPSAIGHSEL